jgi:hypothetical protein
MHKFLKNSPFIIIGLFLLFFIGAVKFSQLILIKNHKMTNCIIYSMYYGGKGSKGQYGLYYNFLFNEKSYKSTVLLTGYVSKLNSKNYFINRTFPIAFNKNFPYLSQPLIFPNDFKEFNIPFPDSLNWVVQYIEK